MASGAKTDRGGTFRSTMDIELLDFSEEIDPAERDKHSLANDQSANRIFDVLARCEAEVTNIDAQAEEAHKRIDARADKLKAGPQRGISYCVALLAEYGERMKATWLKGPKRSHDMIGGRIGWRRSGGRLVVTDKKLLVEWLTLQPVESGLYRMKLEPEMGALQNQFKLDGMVPPGMDVDPEKDSIHIEAASTMLAKATE
jgi:hypothetical protein